MRPHSEFCGSNDVFFTIVREKERGTLEQLFVTPVRPLGLMMGKIMPYFGLAIVELLMILAFMSICVAWGTPSPAARAPA